MLDDSLVTPDRTQQEYAWKPCLNCFYPRIACLCKTESTVAANPSPTKSEHAFLDTRSLQVDLNGIEAQNSLPSPEDEIADLCGRLDKSLKIANDIIMENHSDTKKSSDQLEWSGLSDKDELVLKAPSKIEQEMDGSYSVGKSGSTFTVIRRTLDCEKSSEFDIGLTSTEVFTGIQDTVSFKDLFANISGKLVRQPSQMAWFGNHTYSYRGMSFQAVQLSSCPTIVSVLNLMNNQLSSYGGHKEFNSVFIHLLDDCTDNVDWSLPENDKFDGNQALLFLGCGNRSLQLSEMGKKKKKKKGSKTPVLSSVRLDDGAVVLMEAKCAAEISSRIPRTKKRPTSPSLVLLFKHELSPQQTATPPKSTETAAAESTSEISPGAHKRMKPAVPPRPKLCRSKSGPTCESKPQPQVTKDDGPTLSTVMNAIATLTERIGSLNNVTSSLCSELKSIKATQSLLLDEKLNTASKKVGQRLSKLDANLFSCDELIGRNCEEISKFGDRLDSMRCDIEKLEEAAKYLSTTVSKNNDRISGAQRYLVKNGNAIKDLESSLRKTPLTEAAPRAERSSSSSESSDTSVDNISAGPESAPRGATQQRNLVDGRQYSDVFTTQHDPVTGEPSRISTRRIPVLDKRAETENRGKRRVLYLHDSLAILLTRISSLVISS